MSQQNKAIYPASPKTIHDYAESIFAPIRRGENVTTVWVPMAGRRTLNQFIIKNIDLFKKELPFSERYILVYVEPLDLTEESASGYLRLVGRSFIGVCKKKKEIGNLVNLKSSLEVFNDESTTYVKLLDTLKSLIIDIATKGFETVLFLGEFDEINYTSRVFFGNLKSLWDKVYPSLQFVFLVKGQVSKRDKVYLWGDLNQLILQNLVYVPTQSEEDTLYILDRFSKEFAYNLKKKDKEKLMKCCRGHPYMLKVGLSAIRNARLDNEKEIAVDQLLINHHAIQSIVSGILDVWQPSEIQVLKDVLDGKYKNTDKGEALLTFMRLGLVTADGRQLHLFNKVFSENFRNVTGNRLGNESPALIVDDDSDQITFLGKPVDDRFSQQEYRLLAEFLKSKGKTLSRSEIGDIIWGGQAVDKYSDWAIDQVVSKMRKKLKIIATKDSIITIRGKGYKYQSFNL